MDSDEAKYETYICDYQYKGKSWSVDIPATSFEDAAARLKALSNGKVDGVLKGEFPYHLGWMAKAQVFFGNLLRL